MESQDSRNAEALKESARLSGKYGWDTGDAYQNRQNSSLCPKDRSASSLVKK